MGSNIDEKESLENEDGLDDHAEDAELTTVQLFFLFNRSCACAISTEVNP